MGHFSTLKTNYRFYLITFTEKFSSLINSRIKVMLLDAARKLNLLDLNDNLLFLGFLFSLVTLEAKLSVAQDLI